MSCSLCMKPIAFAYRDVRDFSIALYVSFIWSLDKYVTHTPTTESGILLYITHSQNDSFFKTHLNRLSFKNSEAVKFL
jgi:hypothetical protein